MHADYVSMGGKIFFTPLFLPYIRSTLEVHFFDFILGRATPMKHTFFFFYVLQNIPKKQGYICRTLFAFFSFRLRKESI